MLKKTLYAVLLMAGALGAQSASATTWTFDNNFNPTLGTTSETAGGVTVTASAWANTDGTNTSTELTNNGANQKIEGAYLAGYPGLGVKNKDACGTGYCDAVEGTSPEHATDNRQRYDSIMLSFSESVKLSQLTLTYPSSTSSYDSDVTVLAFDMSTLAANLTKAQKDAAVQAALSGKLYSQLLTSGWKVVGNYADVSKRTGMTADINSGSSNGTEDEVNIGLVSSYWLIGAYNPVLKNSGWSTSAYDYIKLGAVSGATVTNNTPEPGSLVLAGVALAGMMGVRRRKAA